MRKYYTRPCNFYYGNCAEDLIRNNKAFSLAGNQKIAFDQVEIFQRNSKGAAKSEFYSIKEIKDLIFKNTQPKREKEEGQQQEESSALGSLGLKPKPAV